jgi:hypothetical protein
MIENRFGVIAITVFLWAGMATEAGAQGVYYVSTTQPGLARVFCASGEPVLGGGGSTSLGRGGDGRIIPTSLRQNSPISDKSGGIASGTVGTGWQAAASDFIARVRTDVVCADAGLAAAISVQYVSSTATGMARAFCPAGTRVIGGGGLVEAEEGGPREVRLRQTHPISDATGVIAYGTNAIGWQAASSDFADTVVAVAVCAAGGKFEIAYTSAQGTGGASAFCPAGTIVTAGGGFVETSPFAPVSVRGTYPISDDEGRGAWDRNAIGWHTTSSDFRDTVVSFAVCLSGS